jgi:hypothetical protein
MLEERLKGTRRGQRNPDPAVITYADDVRVILRTRDDVPHVRDALHSYEAVSGAHLNIQK